MIHQALKKIREFHNIKQSELSMRLGISNSYLSEIESGKKSPSLELLDKYSDIFNIPVSSLILFSETLDDEEAKASLEASRVACSQAAEEARRADGWREAAEERARELLARCHSLEEQAELRRGSPRVDGGGLW